MLVGAVQVLEHPQPLDAIAGGKGDLAAEALLGFGDEAALVAARRCRTAPSCGGGRFRGR